MSRDRAVSSVLGVVLILGITVGAITAMMLVGAVVIQDTQTDTRHSQMETGMAQMSSKASLAVFSDAGSQRFDLGRIGSGDISIQPHAGNVTIEYVDGDNETTEIYPTSELGALVYSDGDTEIAYQGGGVWRQTGGTTEMVSPPEYHYQAETLTFPIIRVGGDEDRSSRGSGVISHQHFESQFPTVDKTNPIDNATVYVEIESRYHEGWYAFFDARTDGTIDHDRENRTVRAELTAIYEATYSGAVATQGSYDVHHQVNDSTFQEGLRYPSASNVIDERIAGCTDGGESTTPITGDEGTYAGNKTYCAEEELLFTENTVTFDTTDGNISIVVPEGVDFDSADVEIIGDDTVQIYSKGSIEFHSGNQELNVEGDPSQLAVYVHSTVEEIDTRDSNFDMAGIIYAPNTEIELQGSVTFEGAIIVDTFRTPSGQSPDITYDESLDGLGFAFDYRIDELHYLHVTENVISIELD